MLSKDFFRRLELPFPISDVSVRVGTKSKDGKAALPLLYLQAEDVRKRFDLTCAMEGATWSYDFHIVASPSDHVATDIDSKTLAVKATITVCKDNVSISRSSIGEETFINENTEDKNAETRAKSAENREEHEKKKYSKRNMEVYKNAETDAFKRAAARFGVGGYLRQIDKMWFPLNDKGFFSDDSTRAVGLN